MADDARADAILAAIKASDMAQAPLDDREKAAMGYAELLTRNPAWVTGAMIEALRDVGFDDGEILEINQVAAYFNYANRTVLGLGCSTEGDDIGLSPNNSDDPGDWAHR